MTWIRHTYKYVIIKYINKIFIFLKILIINYVPNQLHENVFSDFQSIPDSH